MNQTGKDNIMKKFEETFKRGYNKWNPFKNRYDSYCVGALDGTHIPVRLPSRSAEAYKGVPGRAHDTKVLTHCARYEPFFPHPPSGKLDMAAKLGHRELFSKIIELRPSLLYSRNAHGDTPLHLAALLGDVDIVTQMLNTGLELCSARNNKNQTPLHLACLGIFMVAATLIVEKTFSVDLDELNFAISSGATFYPRSINTSLVAD
ncbi:PREDICTED: ankyrin repeat-containing protein ITN1-like [Camelina sativa]|uniref:Ankyrin repeat-containing protein ITN1-like n=1 Tax=Camelina sativa TaxID=90675 RepID=A0ABM0VZ61_CAMSA|nr:PREDICTED: ankyrin repeat-containing protein ITN1-like [Camelina sativa]